MNQKLDSYHKPVTGRNILIFAFPTIVMTVFNTFYTMVDGLFVSNLIGTDALSAINLTAPAIGLLTAVSGMLATGGSAVVMRKMGEGRHQEARQDFTLLILTNAVIGAVMMTLGYLLMTPLLESMGLSQGVLTYCRDYLSTYFLFTIPILLMYNFSLYLIAADRSRLSLACTVAGGVTNIVLDYVCIALLGMGIRGAAAATGLGYSITAAVGFFVFRRKEALLHFQKPVLRWGVLFHAAANGSSELATSLVSGITTLLFNLAMLRYVGEDGVAAITIIMYVLMFVSALFIGYSYGVAPMISYYHGSGEREKLRALISFSLRFILAVSALCTLVSILATTPLVGIFSRPGTPVYDLAVTGNRLCSLALLFVGLNSFSSGMFTALSNGMVSALLAFSRSFVFTVACIQLLPCLLRGVLGVWLATPAAELLGAVLSVAMLLKYRRQYGYGG